MENRVEISPIFAYLPNGIIREIVAYTGATYKKRNGKYMGQIPKTDPRFALLLKIPKKKFAVNDHLVSNPNCKYFNSWVNLTRIHERCLTVRLAVLGVTYTNDPIFGNKETIEYECRICDRNGNVRCDTYEYYRKADKLDNIIAKCDDLIIRCNKIQSKIDEIEKRIVICKTSIMLLRNACIMTSMFTVGLIVQYFRE